jgi:hypothetical protein
MWFELWWWGWWWWRRWLVGVMMAVVVVVGGGDGGGASVCVDGSEATVDDLGKNNGNLQLTNDTEHQSHGTQTSAPHTL